MLLPAGVSAIFLDDAQTFPAIDIDTPACRARVALQGAQVLQMQPAGKPPLLWLSPGAQFVAGKAVRGGIPLCFPWFAAHPGNAALPAHGFARNRMWSLVSAQRQESLAGVDVVTLRFSLTDDAQTRTLWPHAFHAELTMQISASLQLTLTVHNRSEDDIAFGFALHNYFPVTDIAHVRVDGLEGIAFLDKLAPAALPRQEPHPIRFSGETDRVYRDAPGGYLITDESTHAGLMLSAPQCRSAVVWNPWQEKAAGLGDVPGDAWRRFLCVECGMVGARDVDLRAGATVSFSQEIGWAG